MKEDSAANQDRFVRVRMNPHSGFGAYLLPVTSNAPMLRRPFHFLVCGFREKQIDDRGSDSCRQEIRGAVLSVLGQDGPQVI